MMTPVPSIDALERLREQASELAARAAEMTDHYNRTTWIRLVMVYFPIPFVVVMFRLELEAWAYYVAGALIIVSGAVLYTLDSAASAKVDAAAAAAEKARQAYEEARQEVNPL